MSPDYPEPEIHLNQHAFVDWFRNATPYIHAFRGKTFVIAFDGEILNRRQFPRLAQDLALLQGLGIRLVLVPGTRPQIEARLQQRDAEITYVHGLRITDDKALTCVKEAAGTVRVDIEALLSMGLANTPMAGANIRVASGNYVAAKPLGIRNGVDYLHTGEVRKIDSEAIGRHLDNGAIVLLSPLGYSPTGEVFNLTAGEVATATAITLCADKLIFLRPGLIEIGQADRDRRDLTLDQARNYLVESPADGDYRLLRFAFDAGQKGVKRIHVLDSDVDGALLLELFTRDGIGIMVSTDCYEDMRRGTIQDIGGILQLIAPLEDQGVLVPRSRESLEMEIDDFIVIERDGTIIACAALHRFPDEGMAELACLVVHPQYQAAGYGGRLLEFSQSEAKGRGATELFILTTHAMHWFQERGFKETAIERLPLKRQQLYNYQRRSKLFVKRL